MQTFFFVCKFVFGKNEILHVKDHKSLTFFTCFWHVNFKRAAVNFYEDILVSTNTGNIATNLTMHNKDQTACQYKQHRVINLTTSLIIRLLQTASQSDYL